MQTAKMGFAQTDITPAAPVQMIGFGNTEPSAGVMRPLLAQVSVWGYTAPACCLAAIDHIGFSTENANLVRDTVAARLGIRRENVMLCFAHTHAGPNDSLEKTFFARALDGIARAAEDAASRMTPVCVAWGNGVADIGVNRRDPDGELDKRAGVMLAADAETGAPRLLLLRLTAHCNVLKADNRLVSPDYFGAVRETLGKAYGCAVMATQGASGNVAPRFFCSNIPSPIDANDPKRFTRSDAALEDMAENVLSAVRPVIMALAPKPVTRLSMYSVHTTLTADVPSMERARAVADEARREVGEDGGAWLAEVKRLRDTGVTEQREDAELQYFCVNEGCLCGVRNELMCEFALRAGERLHSDTFYLGGYTNGCTGYFPTEEEFDKGGYEVYWSMLSYFMYHGRVFPLRRESAAQLLNEVILHAPDIVS